MTATTPVNVSRVVCYSRALCSLLPDKNLRECSPVQGHQGDGCSAPRQCGLRPLLQRQLTLTGSKKKRILVWLDFGTSLRIRCFFVYWNSGAATISVELAPPPLDRRIRRIAFSLDSVIDQ